MGRLFPCSQYRYCRGVFHDKDSELQPFSDIGRNEVGYIGNRGWQIPFPVIIALEDFLVKIRFTYCTKDIFIQLLRTRILRDCWQGKQLISVEIALNKKYFLALWKYVNFFKKLLVFPIYRFCTE